MTKFRRETATQAEDLPHSFEAVQRADACHVCGAGSGDARHESWEKEQIAARERAHDSGFVREIGS